MKSSSGLVLPDGMTGASCPISMVSKSATLNPQEPTYPRVETMLRACAAVKWAGGPVPSICSKLGLLSVMVQADMPL